MASIFERKAKVQAFIVFGAFPIAGFFTIVLTGLTRAVDPFSPFFWLGIAGMIVGYGMLVRSKWDQIKRGDFFSWGLSTDAKRLQVMYALSYCLMAGGFLLAGFSGRI